MAIADRHMRPVALVLYDVDSFKAFNDHYGHPAGDACLKQIAAALQSCCRRPNDVVSRYGGEEFAMILPDTDLKGAIGIAESARDAVAALEIPHAFSPAGAHVSISGGIAVRIGALKMTPDELTKMADLNLYEAKRQGRNRLVYESKAA